MLLHFLLSIVHIHLTYPPLTHPPPTSTPHISTRLLTNERRINEAVRDHLGEENGVKVYPYDGVAGQITELLRETEGKVWVREGERMVGSEGREEREGEKMGGSEGREEREGERMVGSEGREEREGEWEDGIGVGKRT